MANVFPGTGLPSSNHEPHFHSLSSSLTKKKYKKATKVLNIFVEYLGVAEPRIQ